MPAANWAAAAPSRAPLAPPATSWSAPNARPPPGSRSSMSATPKGKKPRETRSPASIRRTCSRRTAIWAGAADIADSTVGLTVCSPFVLFGVWSQWGRRCAWSVPVRKCRESIGGGPRNFCERTSRMLKAVFFDIDGTLVDSNDFHVMAWQEAFRDHGHPFDQADIRAHIGKGGDQLVPALLPSSPGAEQKAISDRHGEIFKLKYLAKVKPFACASDLLEMLHARGVE